MNVSINAEDDSWLVHTDGLIAVLKRDCGVEFEHHPAPTLAAAIRLDCYGAAKAFSETLLPNTPMERAGCILNMVMIHLKEHIDQIPRSIDEMSSMRQLDRVKLRSVVKKLYRDLSAVPSLLRTVDDLDTIGLHDVYHSQFSHNF